jgi:hypothetical protein
MTGKNCSRDEFSQKTPKKQGFSPTRSRLAQAVLKALPEGLGRRPIGRPFSPPDPRQSREIIGKSRSILEKDSVLKSA